MKRICPAVKEIIRALRIQATDNVVSEKTIFGLHMLMYHREVKEFDRVVEYCKVFRKNYDAITFEEVKQLAASNEQV